MESLALTQLTTVPFGAISAALPSVFVLSSRLPWHRMVTRGRRSSARAAVKHYSSLSPPRPASTLGRPVAAAPFSGLPFSSSAARRYSSLVVPRSSMPLRILSSSPWRQLTPAPAASFSVDSSRYMSSGYYDNSKDFNAPKTPVHFGVKKVPQGQAYVVERLGKYSRTLTPGINFLIPIVDKIAYVHLLKEVSFGISGQSGITRDNVRIDMDGVLYYKVVDPLKASYGIHNPKLAIIEIAQTTMRSEIGKLSLDKLNEETLSDKIVVEINKAAKDWGLQCQRYEIKDVNMPEGTQLAMQRQAEAERDKRSEILKSEGTRQVKINLAEGEKAEVILKSEAAMQDKINRARGEAQAALLAAEASARRIQMESKALEEKKGLEAANLKIAEQWIKAYSNLAKEANTILLPSNPSDPMSMIAQAMSVYGNLNSSSSLPKPSFSKDAAFHETSSIEDVATLISEPSGSSFEEDVAIIHDPSSSSTSTISLGEDQDAACYTSTEPSTSFEDSDSDSYVA
ncbi:OLC1v1015846C1 [Oldenlandia corymbosa var. corymbosa]|uniref:OLC1v1015846C1 n=1 Tax=Oldenlandia corymbosa var. corymbosa TaxID=529605 RepID=A0AAV1E480_OLDCO|nr:OLC1v1015846C1 [Oldenlandia corymbosa var. corymbosa]